MGVDEAGRGCVIGPMVMAGFMMEEHESLLSVLIHMGVKDSKQLTPLQRNEIVQKLKVMDIHYKIIKLFPPLLDSASLNDLEAKATSDMIMELKPERVYLDVPTRGRGITRYCEYVREGCKEHSVELIGGNHMDRDNLFVASASILAKTLRDTHRDMLKLRYGEFGSGYPSDPLTRAWLKEWRRTHDAWPSIVRTKWSTLSSLLKEMGEN